MKMDSQENLKISIKMWLKAGRHDYAWLATRCYVSESTVRNWMARRYIPKAKLDIIRRLMIQDLSPKCEPSIEIESETHISMQLSPDVFYKLRMLADSRKMSLEQLIMLKVTELADETE